MFFGDDNFERREPWRLSARHIFRKIFLEDWMMKAVALAITLALWLGVTGLSTPTTTRFSSIPLTLRVSSTSEIVNTPVQDVDIVVSGDKRKIDQINKSDLLIAVDLTDVPPGDRLVQLAPENVMISLPTGIKLDKIEPDRIAVKLEPVEEKEIAVQIETEGDVPDGYEIYATIASPQKVRVRGPASVIRTLNFVTTDKIDLAGHSSDFIVKQIPISVSDPKATVLETVVDVAFRIGEKRVERLYLVPVAGETKRATVVLFGPRSLFDNVKPEDMSVQLTRNDAGIEVPQLTLPSTLQGNVEIRQLKVQSP